jgi:phosphopantetheine--protein transferase-like protein
MKAPLILARKTPTTWLSGDEIKEMRKRIPSKINVFLRGRMAAKRGVLKLLKKGNIEQAYAGIEILSNLDGLPYVRLPDPGTVPLMSISHSAQLSVAISVASDKCEAVGIDLEKIRDFKEKTAKSFLTPAEYRLCTVCRGYEYKKLLTLHWCLKEAYVKALGVGIRLHPSKIEIELTDENSAIIKDTSSHMQANAVWVLHDNFFIAVVCLLKQEKK